MGNNLLENKYVRKASGVLLAAAAIGDLAFPQSSKSKNIAPSAPIITPASLPSVDIFTPEPLRTLKSKEITATSIPILDKRDLTQDGLINYVFNELNPSVENLENNQDNKRYCTVFVSKTFYDNFSTLSKKWNAKGETFADFMARHVNSMNKHITDANLLIADYLKDNPKGTLGDYVIRRIVVVGDGIEGISPQDSDGEFSIYQDYDPTQAYWNPNTKEDDGLKHELFGHRTGWVPDYYAGDLDDTASSGGFLLAPDTRQQTHIQSLLRTQKNLIRMDKNLTQTEKDTRIQQLNERFALFQKKQTTRAIYESATTTTNPLDDPEIPDIHRRYMIGFGWSDYGHGLMTDSNPVIDRPLALQMARHNVRGNPHRADIWGWEGFWSYPNGPEDMPDTLTLQFGTSHIGDTMEVWQTTAPNSKKGFKQVASLLIDQNGEAGFANPFLKPDPIPPGEIFQIDGLLPSFNSDIFIKIKRNGKTIGYRFFDWRLPFEAAQLGYTKEAIFSLNLLDKNKPEPTTGSLTHKIVGGTKKDASTPTPTIPPTNTPSTTETPTPIPGEKFLEYAPIAS